MLDEAGAGRPGEPAPIQAKTNVPMVLHGESEPLYPAGVHEVSLDELQKTCVDDFPLSDTRANIMRNLRGVVQRLANAGVKGVFWIDGSFTTRKVNPADVDLVFITTEGSEFSEANTEHRNALIWLAENLKHSHLCDSYICPQVSQAHENFDFWNDRREYWKRQFGFSRGMDTKGIVAVRI